MDNSCFYAWCQSFVKPVHLKVPEWYPFDGSHSCEKCFERAENYSSSGIFACNKHIDVLLRHPLSRREDTLIVKLKALIDAISLIETFVNYEMTVKQIAVMNARIEEFERQSSAITHKQKAIRATGLIFVCFKLLADFTQRFFRTFGPQLMVHEELYKYVCFVMNKANRKTGSRFQVYLEVEDAISDKEVRLMSLDYIKNYSQYALASWIATPAEIGQNEPAEVENVAIDSSLSLQDFCSNCLSGRDIQFKQVDECSKLTDFTLGALKPLVDRIPFTTLMAGMKRKIREVEFIEGLRANKVSRLSPTPLDDAPTVDMTLDVIDDESSLDLNSYMTNEESAFYLPTNTLEEDKVYYDWDDERFCVTPGL